MTPLAPKNKYDSITFRYVAPQGTCWIQVFEYTPGKIDRVILTVGKAGSDIMALCSAISELVTNLFQNDTSITEVISHLSGITSDKSHKWNGLTIHTPIDALVVALIKYRASITDEEVEMSTYLRQIR